MTVLPIVERELRVAARQGATYWVRLGLAAVAMLVGTVVFVLTLDLRPAQAGRSIFECLSAAMLLYCLAYGRRSTADCLSQEKREGTLGLLFLTDLKGRDVVLGKLVATSTRGFYGLLAMFPVLAVPLLLGGITNGEFWRAALVLVDTFLFSLAIGILGSALTRDVRQAMGANLFLLLLFMAVPAACMFALAYFVPRFGPIPQLLFSCPVYAFYLCDDSHYRLAQPDFWWSVAMIHALTWLLLMAAAWVVPRSWQERAEGAQKSRGGSLWHTWRHGPEAGKAEFRKQALDTNAFYWLAARARFKPVHVWTFLGCIAAWWLAGWIASGKLWLDPSVAYLTAVLANFGLKVWLAIEAGQQLAEDRRSGAFELLLSLPLTVQDIVRGQLLALRRQFLKPLLVVLGVEACLMVTVNRHVPGRQTQAIWLAGMFILVADLLALSWVGMWRALVARSHNVATIGTVTRVLLLPWGLFGWIVGVGHIWYGLSLGKEWSPGWKFYLSLWMGLGLAADLIFGLTAWWQLRFHFRQLALRRFNPVPSGLGRWVRSGRTESSGASEASAPTRGTGPNGPPKCQESTKDKGGTVPALSTAPQVKLALSKSRLRFALLGIIALLLVGVGFIALRRPSHFPPPLVVSLNQSNGPVQVFPSSSGVVLILPDGSLWRWDRSGMAGVALTPFPKRVGTNSDWAQAAASFNYMVGVHRDGTLWEWGSQNVNPRRGSNSGTGLRQVDPGHDWVAVAAGTHHTAALRRDGTLWCWGNNYADQLGNGPGPDETDPVQVGTNSDWVAVCCALDYTLSLRRDGTLWTWGTVYTTGSGGLAVNKVPFPTQVCRETNWAGFSPAGFLPLVRTRSGELWEPGRAPPAPETPALVAFQLIASNAVPCRFATAWCGETRAYEVRPDGTLWGRAQPLGFGFPTSVGQWRQVGKRSDWKAVWGASGVGLGLTADGTLWTWGLDLSRAPAANARLRLSQLQMMMASLFGSRPRPIPGGGMPAFQEQPRPVMRLVPTNMARIRLPP